jgi:hypothetical protein
MDGSWWLGAGRTLAALIALAAVLPFAVRFLWTGLAQRSLSFAVLSVRLKNRLARVGARLARLGRSARNRPLLTAWMLLLLYLAGYTLLNCRAKPGWQINPALCDMATYVVGVLQDRDPTALVNDPIFGNRVWSRSYPAAYMFALEKLYHWAGRDFPTAFDWYNLLVLAVYCAGMFVFLRSVVQCVPLALILTILSSQPSELIVTGTYWGVNSAPLPALLLNVLGIGVLVPPSSTALALPFVVYTALTPWLGWLALEYWYRPGWSRRPVAWWCVLGIGLAVGLSYHVHPIGALAVAELFFLAGVVQVLRRRLPAWTLGVFLLGVLPFLGWRMLHGSGVVHGMSFESARLVLDMGGQGSMVYPWRSLRQAPWWPQRLSSQAMIYTFFGSYTFFSLLGAYLIRRRDNWSRRGWLLFVTVQGLLTWVTLQTGWLALLLIVYAWWRLGQVWQGRETLPQHRGRETLPQHLELDCWLLTALVIGILIGPAQQLLFYLA